MMHISNNHTPQQKTKITASTVVSDNSLLMTACEAKIP